MAILQSHTYRTWGFLPLTGKDKKSPCSYIIQFSLNNVLERPTTGCRGIARDEAMRRGSHARRPLRSTPLVVGMTFPVNKVLL